MSYTLTLVQLTGSGLFASNVGNPNGMGTDNGSGTYLYPNLLFSAWFCIPVTSSWSYFNVTGNPFDFSFSNTTASISINGGYGNPNSYQAQFSIPNRVFHLLMSFDMPSETAQFYINDAPVTLTSSTWSSNSNFGFSTGVDQYRWGWTSANNGPNVGDVWTAANPTLSGFYDLTITSNRRKFINADGTPVDLGITGDGPIGASPQQFFTASTSLAGFTTNSGTSGAWNMVLGGGTAAYVSGTCAYFPTGGSYGWVGVST